MLIINNNPQFLVLLSIFYIFCNSCHAPKDQVVNENMKTNIQLITLDPGHFHAALVQKNRHSGLDNTVHIYAPEGNDLKLHLNRIEAFNERANNPTDWNSILYTGDDYFEKMLEHRKGNVVVLAGNNRKKTAYIFKAVNAGLNVLSDKPMAINMQDFDLLRNAFEIAKKNDVLLYDIMTERFEITSILQRAFMQNKIVFGDLEKGTIGNPAVVKESVHHFFKYVSGNTLTRPPWYFDVLQQGEGIVDVTTHLIDLVQWLPEILIDYEKDIHINKPKRWPTILSFSQFKDVTKMESFPDYLEKDILKDSLLKVFCNGEINYQIKGVHTKVSVIWNYRAPDGAGDTHFSTIQGTKAKLVIRQGEAQNYKPILYIEPNINDVTFEELLKDEFVEIEKKFPGIILKENKNGWEVVVPEKYSVGHAAHFSQVMEKYIEYLTEGNMPDWEVPNMIAKYYTTTKALELAKNNNATTVD